MTRTWADPMTRLFIACDLPKEIEEAVVAWQIEAFAGRPELRRTLSLHVTLCFLGKVARAYVPAISEALAALDIAPLPVNVTGAVFLPESGRKRVVALRLEDPSEALVRLQAEVSETLSAMHIYKPEKRPYLPHLTVARFRRPGEVFPLQNVNVPSFGLPSVVLYTSVLEKGGAVHTPLATFPTS